MAAFTSSKAEVNPLSEECLSQHMAFIRNLERQPALVTDASSFKMGVFTYRLFPVLSWLSGKLSSEILLDGQACRNLYLAALEVIDPTYMPPQEIALMRILGIELPGNMHLVAITAESNHLVARLSGGRVIKCRHSDVMVAMLVAEGVHASEVRVPDWRAGSISPLKNQKIAIFGLLRESELRRE